MANTDIQNVRRPTAQQSMLIKLAMRKGGATREDVRTALNYESGANIPVQSMLKHLAERFGLTFSTDEGANKATGRKIAVYHLSGKIGAPAATKAAPAKARRAMTKATKAGKAKGAKAAKPSRARNAEGFKSISRKA